MAFNFSAGHLVPVEWQRSGTAVITNLNIKSHDLRLSCLLHDVSGSGSGAGRARLAGPLDVAGQVMCDLDLDNPPYVDPPLIVPGVSGVCNFGLSASKGIQVPVIVEELHFTSAFEQQVKWDFSVKMNQLAGVIVYPAL